MAKLRDLRIIVAVNHLDPGLALLGTPFVLIALGSVLLNVRLSPIRLLLALVSAMSTVGSIYGLLYLTVSWSTAWLVILLWLVAFVAGSIVLAITAERTGGSSPGVVLSGAATGLVLLGVYIFSQGWIAVIIGMGVILLALLPAGLAYGVIGPTGIAKKVRDGAVVTIAGIFGLVGFAMLDNGEVIVKGIGLIPCLVTVGLLMLAFPELRPRRPTA